MTSLGYRQAEVLRGLDNASGWGSPPTPRELAQHLWAGTLRYRRSTSDTESVQGALARLARKGYAERIGTASDGSRTWQITDLGRAWIIDHPR